VLAAPVEAQPAASRGGRDPARLGDVGRLVAREAERDAVGAGRHDHLDEAFRAGPHRLLRRRVARERGRGREPGDAGEVE
jgi:hypothetical protein